MSGGKDPLGGVGERFIYTLTRLSIDASKAIKEDTSLRTCAKILVAYARLWALRESEMKALLNRLKRYKITLPQIPSKNQGVTAKEVLKSLAGAATLLNIYILAKMKS